jgi:hypothetical protein
MTIATQKRSNSGNTSDVSFTAKYCPSAFISTLSITFRTANTALHKPVFIFNGHVSKHVAVDILKTLGGTRNGGMAAFIDKVSPHTQKDVLSAIVGEDVNISVIVSGSASLEFQPETLKFSPCIHPSAAL